VVADFFDAALEAVAFLAAAFFPAAVFGPVDDVAFFGAALRGAAFFAAAFVAGAELRADAPERRAVDFVAMGDSLVGNCHTDPIYNTRIAGRVRFVIAAAGTTDPTA
jgi:hypothetical protein